MSDILIPNNIRFDNIMLYNPKNTPTTSLQKGKKPHQRVYWF